MICAKMRIGERLRKISKLQEEEEVETHPLLPKVTRTLNILYQQTKYLKNSILNYNRSLIFGRFDYNSFLRCKITELGTNLVIKDFP